MKQNAIICDLDGTLCNIDHRIKYIDGSLGKKDWDRFYSECGNDKANEWCLHIINSFVSLRNVLTPSMKILFVTGRPEKIKDITIEWIGKHFERHFKNDYEIFMRKNNDFRKDCIIKKEIYEEHIKDKYDVLFCLEDRQQVVDMWRSLRLVCLQCDEGKY